MLRLVRAATVTLLVLAVAYGLGTWWDFTFPSLGGARYQAVFLTNGQVYFGRYHDRFGPYVRVDDAYYIQPTQAPAPSADAPPPPPQQKLVRRGTELQAPRQPLYLAKTAIVFVEDLRPDGEVAKFMDAEPRR